MDLRVLRYLVAIVDTGGFIAAAEQVHLSQPALSKAIRALEDEIGFKLLERRRRGGKIRLTPAGQVVYHHAVSLLDERQRMLGELNALHRLERGVLSIGLSPLGSAELFAPLMALYRTRYPQVEIQLMERGGAEQEEALRNGEIELATSLIPHDSKEMDWLQLREDPMLVALPSHHPLAQSSELHFSDLGDAPLVIYAHGFMLNRVIREAGRQEGYNPRDIIHISQSDFGLALVAAGTGVMILPKLIAERHVSRGIVLKPLNSTLRWQLSLVWRRDVTLSFAASAMLQLVREHLPIPTPQNLSLPTNI